MKKVLVTVSDPPGDPRALEALRVAAGLAQLSELKVHLLIETQAEPLLHEDGGGAGNSLARDYLKLLLEAGGLIHGNETCPAVPVPLQRHNPEELRKFRASIPLQIEI